MTANELRIGNWVYTDHKTDLVSIVKSISEESIDVMFDRQPDLVNGIISHSEKLHGIPLTEEWLLKFGVTIDTYFSENGSEMMAIETAYFESICSHIPLKYVHQLQNLYYALTGEELTIKTK